MKRTKKIAVAAVATLILAGVATTPAQAAPVKPQGSAVCVWFPSLPWCRR